MATRPVALLFDLDGTLVDTIELIMQSMEFAFQDFDGPRPTRAEWLEGLGIPLRTLFAAHARTAEELDWMVARYRIFQGEHQEQMTVAYPGVVEVLAELHEAGHPMGIVTSKFHAGANIALKHVGIAHLFGTVIGADSIEKPKPHPQAVLKALDDLGATPDRAVMIGDSPHDIAAGNAAGAETAAVLWGPFVREQFSVHQPTHWLAEVSELRSLGLRTVDRGRI